MNRTKTFCAIALSMASALASAPAVAEDDADSYAKTRQVFVEAGESGKFFDDAYGYALFPTIGKGGMVVGGSYGEGRVYVGGRHVGNSRLAKASIGFQLGGQAYSQVIFFRNRRAFDAFTSGEFEFGADASAVAITAGASASANTAGGASAGASGGKHDAKTAGGYHDGMAVFTVAKGGLMYEASVSGQKYQFEPLEAYYQID